jgi:hypothetical protein
MRKTWSFVAPAGPAVDALVAAGKATRTARAVKKADVRRLVFTRPA